MDFRLLSSLLLAGLVRGDSMLSPGIDFGGRPLQLVRWHQFYCFTERAKVSWAL